MAHSGEYWGENVLTMDVQQTTSTRERSDTRIISEDDKGFCELFNLPVTEYPLPGWEGGRRCTIINKEKPLPSAFKHGKLYLTRSFLCFERYKTQSPKNVIVALADVTSVQKAKPYSWLPGAGMSIEITLAGYDRPYIFGALLGRDEVYESIIVYGKKANLPWADVKDVAGAGKEIEKEEEKKEDAGLSTPQPGSPRASPSRNVRMSEIKDCDDDVDDLMIKSGGNMF